ncbi:MAG: TetR/AcrR family transcriptional regulator [Aeromicrobium erythreum]
MPTDPTLRKTPRQARSRDMVDRIVRAGRAVLVEQGWERATTNRVAERAGISPGSLYQYFPNKEAVLAAVIEQYSAEIADELTAVLAGRLDLPRDQLVRTTYTALLDVLEAHREYVRLTTLELPRQRVASSMSLLERRIDDLVGAYLTISRVPTRLDPGSSAWLLVRMVEHLSVQYVLERPPIDREAFVDELVRLTEAHLAPGDA